MNIYNKPTLTTSPNNTSYRNQQRVLNSYKQQPTILRTTAPFNNDLTQFTANNNIQKELINNYEQTHKNKYVNIDDDIELYNPNIEYNKRNGSYTNTIMRYIDHYINIDSSLRRKEPIITYDDNYITLENNCLQLTKGSNLMFVKCNKSFNVDDKIILEGATPLISGYIDSQHLTFTEGSNTVSILITDKNIINVLPLTNDKLDINDGLLLDGDALTKSFYESLIPLIKDKTIIVLENPPYSEPAAEAIRKGRTIKGSSNNYITDLMKCNNINGITARETANKFIWSAFELIKADYCIIYSPVKYFKSQSLINKQFIEGCIVNKKDFHATVGGISIMSWKNEDELVNEWKLENTIIKRVISKCSNNMPNKTSDGYVYISTKPLTPDYKNGHLENLYDNTCSTYNTVRLCNSLTIKQAIPLFVANCYKCKNYLEKEVIMKSSDKGLTYLNDKEFINDCLIWAGLSDKNKCISNCNITNQCCIGQITELDSIIDPVAYNTKAKKLKELWDNILTFIKSTSEYNASYKYGLYQINKDINVKVIVKTINGTYAINKTGNNIIEHKYSILNELIKKLKKELQNYYDKYISNKLFEYELLK